MVFEPKKKRRKNPVTALSKGLEQDLRRQGYAWNHKRIHRIYCLLKLNFRRKGKQRLPVRNPLPLATPEALNQS